MGTGKAVEGMVEYERQSGEEKNKVREQLSLFPTEEQTSLVYNWGEAGQPPTTRERLQVLLEDSLDFRGAKTGYASHHLHSFAAKFPPQLPQHFILGLTQPGDTVLDPMAGSGTAIVEAVMLDRVGIGVDLDPLAVQISRAKTTRVSPRALSDAAKRVLTRAHRYLDDGGAVAAYLDLLDEPTREFIDYWFLPATQRELAALILSIRQETDVHLKRLLLLIFSSIIVTKSGGVSLARDLAHSRPHRDLDKKPRNAFELFQYRVRRALSGIDLLPQDRAALIIHGNARKLPLTDNSVHLIVTSPPYANAIDYMRAHKFSLVWIGRPIEELARWRARYIGAERLGDFTPPPFPPETQSIVDALARRDTKRSRVLAKYLAEMRDVLAEMHRVLRPDAPAAVVVGTSIMRGLNIQTHLCLAEIATDVGFDLVRISERKLDRDRRMMPARFGKKSSQIEERMHHEYVIGLLKPEAGNERAIQELDNESQYEMLETLVEGRRLRDIADLPFDLAI